MESTNSVISVLDKNFEVMISSESIRHRIQELGTELNQDLKDKDPLFIAILNGSFIFASDLYREIDIPSEITFIKLSSYNNLQSTGKIRELIGLQKIYSRGILFWSRIL